MKITHLLCAAVLGATLTATTQSADAHPWWRGGYRFGYTYVAPRVVVRPYVAPAYVAPAYVAPSYTYVDPYYVAPAPVVVRPRPYVVVRPRPVIVRRGWYRRW